MVLYRVEKICDGVIFEVRYYESEESLKKGLKWHGLPYEKRPVFMKGGSFTHRVWKLTGWEDVTDSS